MTSPATYKPLTQQEMVKKIDDLKQELAVTEETARKIEVETRGQRTSPRWFEMRRLRLTASMFGQIKQLKTETAPDNLVLRILGVKRVSVTTAMQWGIDHEDLAIQLYTDYQHRQGHSGLYVCTTGLFVSSAYPFLGTSPDGAVYDPTSSSPYGFLEVKCPYTQRQLTPVQACSCQGFSSKLENGQPALHHTHPYYSQVQGQMAIGGRTWCDFVLYTEKGISVERIPFDSSYCENELLPKLVLFMEKCFAPEIVHPVHHLGLPIRDMRKVRV